MDNFIELLSKFEGIIGALLGVIVTLTLTQMLKTFGKIRFYLLEKKIEYRVKLNDWGQEEVTNTLENAHYAVLNLKMELYNGSEIPKVLRDIKLRFYSNKICLFDIEPDNSDTFKVSAGRQSFDKFLNVNIAPKTILTIELRAIIPNEHMDKYRNTNKIYLTAKDHKGSIKRSLIPSSDNSSE